MIRNFFNHYSVLIVLGLLVSGGLFRVVRGGAKTHDWLIVSGGLVGFVAVWWVVRPVARSSSLSTGQPVLLEVQSPFCLGCVAVKPAVDRLENEWRGKLQVQRVDIQSPAGKRLVSRYHVERTPTFIFFDGTGREQWRSVGGVDAAQVRSILEN